MIAWRLGGKNNQNCSVMYCVRYCAQWFLDFESRTKELNSILPVMPSSGIRFSPDGHLCGLDWSWKWPIHACISFCNRLLKLFRDFAETGSSSNLFQISINLSENKCWRKSVCNLPYVASVSVLSCWNCNTVQKTYWNWLKTDNG